MITNALARSDCSINGRFKLPNGEFGSLITTRTIDKHKNGEPSEIEIVLGSMLLPNFTHSLPKGEKRRLIPITDLPPLIGSPNTHAAQAMLQLFILEEFSNQSTTLSEKGYIYVPLEKWKDFAKQADLPVKQISKIIDGWTEDDLLHKAFLQKYKDDYTLGPSYGDVVQFLKDQGKKIIEGAIGGKKSAEAKKIRAKKGFNFNKKK